MTMIHSFEHVARGLLGDRLKVHDSDCWLGYALTILVEPGQMIPGLLVLVDVYQSDILKEVVHLVKDESYGQVHTFCSYNGGLNLPLSWGNILGTLEQMYNRASNRDLYSITDHNEVRIEILNLKLEVLKNIEKLVSQ